ncbi:MAG: peroxiredoxin family protein [Flavobacterium sp.]|nr:peroxiredoxin family protein [Flavobacterium sp.]
MKKILKTGISILILSLIAFMSYSIISKINHKKEIAENIKQIPSFSYLTLQEEIFTHKNLKENTPKLFIYFNSECDFCNEEAKMIKENIKKFKNIEVVFISYEALEKIKQFATTYQLNNYDNITFLSDSKATFATTFDVKSMPCLVLYNKENKLIEKIKGQTKVETVLEKFRNF